MFTLPNLPYAYNALEPYIDEETMRLHHDKHHAAYVANLNDALAGSDDLIDKPIEHIMMTLDTIPETIRMKVRNHGGGHINHTMFWSMLSPAKSSPKGKFLDALMSEFGSVEKFQDFFTNVAIGRFGSGWAWLVLDKSKKLTLLDTLNQDTPISSGQTPLLCLDVWEHAYYLKYQNRRAEYIRAWWNVVNWSEVEKRFEHAI